MATARDAVEQIIALIEDKRAFGTPTDASYLAWKKYVAEPALKPRSEEPLTLSYLHELLDDELDRFSATELRDMVASLTWHDVIKRILVEHLSNRLVLLEARQKKD